MSFSPTQAGDIARSIQEIARALKMLTFEGPSGEGPGAIEHFDIMLKEELQELTAAVDRSGENIRTGLEAVATAIEKHTQKMYG